MKKLKLLLLTILSTIGLSSCNMQVIDLKLSFDKAHLVSKNECVEIKSWRNYEDGDMVQITLKDDSVVLGHSNEIILIKGNCPYCK